MKVLWFCNRPIINKEIKDSGSWIGSMAWSFENNPSIDIYVISDSKGVTAVQESTRNNIHQFLLPRVGVNRNGLPNNDIISTIITIVDSIKPNLIHVWGVENYWGLLFSRGIIKHQHLLLDIQGVLEACRDFYKGNLNFGDFYREMPFYKAIYSYCFITIQQYRMHKRIKYENEIVSFFPNIGYQSDWVYNWLKYKETQANLYKSLISVRSEFHKAPFWEQRKNQTSILLITSSQCYKRIDIAVKALSIINKKNHVNLIIAGVTLDNKRGYDLYLSNLIKKLDIKKNIEFVGNVTAAEIKDLAKRCCCALIPSAVESYSLVLAECKAHGIPIIASYAGAMPELGGDTPSVKYFPSGDFVSCANLIEYYMECQYNNCVDRFDTTSKEGVAPSLRQLDIYHKILTKIC